MLNGIVRKKGIYFNICIFGFATQYLVLYTYWHFRLECKGHNFRLKPDYNPILKEMCPRTDLILVVALKRRYYIQ